LFGALPPKPRPAGSLACGTVRSARRRRRGAQRHLARGGRGDKILKRIPFRFLISRRGSWDLGENRTDFLIPPIPLYQCTDLAHYAPPPLPVLRRHTLRGPSPGRLPRSAPTAKPPRDVLLGGRARKSQGGRMSYLMIPWFVRSRMNKKCKANTACTLTLSGWSRAHKEGSRRAEMKHSKRLRANNRGRSPSVTRRSRTSRTR